MVERYIFIVNRVYRTAMISLLSHVSHDQRRVRSPKTKGVGKEEVKMALPRLGYDIQAGRLLVGPLEIDITGDKIILHHQD